jgi:hypothetical protein
MIKEVIALFKEFKALKDEDKLVIGGENRALIGRLAVAQAIDRLAIAVEKIGPCIGDIAAYLTNPPMEYTIEDVEEISEEEKTEIRRIVNKYVDKAGDPIDTCSSCEDESHKKETVE